MSESKCNFSKILINCVNVLLGPTCPARNVFPKHVLWKNDSDDEDEDGGRDGRHGPVFIHFLGKTFVISDVQLIEQVTKHVSEQTFKEIE